MWGLGSKERVTLVSAPTCPPPGAPPGQPLTRLGIVVVTRNRVATVQGTLARLTALPETPAIVVPRSSAAVVSTHTSAPAARRPGWR